MSIEINIGEAGGYPDCEGCAALRRVIATLTAERDEATGLLERIVKADKEGATHNDVYIVITLRILPEIKAHLARHADAKKISTAATEETTDA